MMHPDSDSSLQFATLDPPGTIAVIGGGALGVEAALYGRFLGYAVTLIEAKSIGNSADAMRDQPLPVLPNRCLSSLAISALSTQTHESGPQALPTTIGQWIDDGLVGLTQTDLLRGRVMTQTKVASIELVPIEVDSAGEASETEMAVPDDFRLHLEPESGEMKTLDVEAVIVATGNDDTLHQTLPASTDYWFRVNGQCNDAATDDVERQLRRGYQQIVDIFARLGGRETLDLYRPRRL
jgi:thioredoxin reductase